MKILPYRNVEDFCVAYGCPRNKLSSCSFKKVSFHRFPKDKDLRNKWVVSLKLSVQPTANSVLCSNHFQPDCFVAELKLKESRPTYYRVLKKDAVPTVPAIQIALFVRPNSHSVLGRLENCENEMPAKVAKLQETHATSQSGRFLRTPLTSGNWNPTDSSEMASGDNRATGDCQGYFESTLTENSSDKDDDVQVLRVFESLANKAERHENIVFRNRSRLDSRHSIRPNMRAKTDRRISTLDKTDDLEQHQRYKALLNESSTSLNSGYKNEDPLYPAAGSYLAENSMLPEVKQEQLDHSEYIQFEADYPRTRSAETILQNGKHTTDWIVNMQEKCKKLYREEMMKAEKMQELTEHLRKHNEKLEQDVEKKQWDWRSAFEIFKIEDEARALPTLTPEMEEIVRKALTHHPEDEKLVSAAKFTIAYADVNTLRGLSWLNDEIINCYMELIKLRSNSSNGKYPKALTFNTFFYLNLVRGNNSLLKRWHRKLDLFSYDMILVPIHEGIHWCMAQIDFRSKRMLYLDSMGGKNTRCLELCLGYLVYESKERNVSFNPEDWSLENAQGNPKQRNGSDCGVFACTYAEFLSRDAKFLFEQSDMPFIRRKMVYEVLHGLLPI